MVKGKYNAEEYVRVRLPNRSKHEMFAIADKLVGGSRIQVVCEDGKNRLGRILGRIRKRQWIREGDLLIIRPWDFQPEKCDVISRYKKTQSINLSRRSLLPPKIDIFKGRE
ncbi:MAG TPA: translation initiation factor eIF-1A [Thermoplasmata archaeon]|nr:translation initiation factor eIF-1A [Thermoplasmata archaeon]